MGIAEFQDNITILFINIPDYYRIDLTVPVIVQNLPAQFCRTFFNVLTFCDLIFGRYLCILKEKYITNY